MSKLASQTENSKTDIILASQSLSRRKIMERAGLSFEVVPADIDEEAIRKQAKTDNYFELASILAREKARIVSEKYPDILVVGSDQLLRAPDGELLHKSNNREEAAKKLSRLAGKTHHLISAVSVCRSGEEIFSHVEDALLDMRPLSGFQIEHYLDQAGEGVLRSVGAYELESVGSWLFERVEGDYYTILGMPLLPLLSYLSEQRVGLWS